MKSVALVLASFVSVTAFAAPNSNSRRTENRYAQFSTATAPTATSVETVRTRRSYIGTDVFSWTRSSFETENDQNGQGNTSENVSNTFATSPSNFQFVGFWDRYALRLEKDLTPDSQNFGGPVQGQTIAASKDASIVGLGYLFDEKIEIGAAVQFFKYSVESEAGNVKTSADWSEYAFGPYAVYTTPMSSFDLEIGARALMVTGVMESKDTQGVRTKLSDASGFMFGADALGMMALNDVLDFGAGANFQYLKITDKRPQNLEVTTTNLDFGLTFAHVRFKF